LVATKTKFVKPTTGYIFQFRKNAKVPHLHYMAVYSQIKKQAPKFYQDLKKRGEKVCEDVQR